MRLHFQRLRFVMRADEPVYVPPGKVGNVLRGALGLTLQEVSPEAYGRLFAPRMEGGPSGLADAPRPFVFRVADLEDGLRVGPGETFAFSINLFTDGGDEARLFCQAFELLGRDGLGPGRGKATLADTEAEAASVDLETAAGPVSAVGIRFVTPTEIKGEQGRLARPEFGVMLARIRDRVSTLRALYGGGPLEMDFRGFGERAAGVRMVECEVRSVAVERRSTRTGQRHPLGGFTGYARYEGDLAEFLPFLRAAEVTGVGRQTVWGNGEISVSA